MENEAAVRVLLGHKGVLVLLHLVHEVFLLLDEKFEFFWLFQVVRLPDLPDVGQDERVAQVLRREHLDERPVLHVVRQVSEDRRALLCVLD